MHPDDIAQVIAIEKRSFSTPWSPRTYAYEINESENSHMVVLSSIRVDRPRVTTGMLRLLRALGYPSDLRTSILAYGGLWRLAEEAHISTIATHPEQRRRHYGEAVLVAMMMRAVILDAAYMALEVRVSNLGAQALYRKHGFEVYGTKFRYYLDDLEDAYDMRVNLTDAHRQHIQAAFKSLTQDMTILDTYTQATLRG
ncbi:MAG: GNAT family N-acetyltransferase [Chloroflexi bacterium]|jgi:ribosomal-protein-alanine N-acetyltransferase|nr:MAG: ribosomal-protein-alanine acetyltransferase [Chloroflexi bacterium OLB13]MBC6956985.1 GNAT family N-acetyltransferase [Chloroflexota bacterium]MBV6437309.1 hypothetical protein [Anaerolineae bacterium]OQY86547.1 MAG: hypothetical protein B6D42_00975 [Anaerolineae bacterium UTCFX5]RIK22196.1 MAG: ribosomal-protein-alanine N-acetyltransferase [Chloroflexota bacterium]